MCQRCGSDVSYVPSSAQQRIQELEQQVKILTDKATAAGTSLNPSDHFPFPTDPALVSFSSSVKELTSLCRLAADKLADYEDEIRHLKSSPNPNTHSSNPELQHLAHDPPSRPPSAMQSRFSALLSSTKRSISQPPTSPMPFAPPPHNHPQHASIPGAFPFNNNPPLTSDSDLRSALNHETSLRHAAESRFSKSQEEVEELSTQLFAEANEMVATERKERKRLEDKIETLERRARDKDGRLEVLEGRVRRGERVRGLLAQTQTMSSTSSQANSQASFNTANGGGG